MSGTHTIDTSIKAEEASAEGDSDCSEQGFINASQLDPVQLDKAEKAVIKFHCDR